MGKAVIEKLKCWEQIQVISNITQIILLHENFMRMQLLVAKFQSRIDGMQPKNIL